MRFLFLVYEDPNTGFKNWEKGIRDRKMEVKNEIPASIGQFAGEIMLAGSVVVWRRQRQEQWESFLRLCKKERRKRNKDIEIERERER